LRSSFNPSPKTGLTDMLEFITFGRKLGQCVVEPVTEKVSVEFLLSIEGELVSCSRIMRTLLPKHASLNRRLLQHPSVICPFV
jgi:hypothetical protein